MEIPKARIDVNNHCCNKSIFACLCISSCCKKVLPEVDKVLKDVGINDKDVIKNIYKIVDKVPLEKLGSALIKIKDVK